MFSFLSCNFFDILSIIKNWHTSHRSVHFYDDDAQKKLAIKTKDEFNKIYDGKIATNISKIKNYCKAEEYHQKYIEKNRR